MGSTSGFPLESLGARNPWHSGWAAGGGHSLHATCDLTLASREHARFKQTDADVGSFDGSFGSAYLARQVGQKFAREIFFLELTRFHQCNSQRVAHYQCCGG